MSADPLRIAIDAIKDALARGVRNREELRAYAYEYVTCGRIPRDGEPEAIDEAMQLYAEVLDEEVVRGRRLRVLCTDGPLHVPASLPCPHVTCRYHLGELRAPATPGRVGTVPLDASATCALDVADDGSHSLKETGRYFGLTRERVRQIQGRALIKLKAIARRFDLDLADIVPRASHALSEIVRENHAGRDLVKLRASQRRWNEKHRAKKAAQG